jgi:hypothetical protein
MPQIGGPAALFVILALAIALGLFTVVIVGIAFWYKTRARELNAHRDMRIREMEHQRIMKNLELDIEKTKAVHSET